MKDLIILGTGIHSLEMAEIIERINSVNPEWRLLGYLSPDGKQVGTRRNDYLVLGGADEITRYPGAWFVPDNEWPHNAPLPWERTVSIIDPSAFVSHTATLGKGCVVYPYCFIGANAVLGDRIFMLAGCTINHDDIIGHATVLASGVTLAGSVQVQSRCYLGQSCTVRQLLCIGEGSTVGMGAVVVKNVPPHSVMVGNPARVLKMKDASREGV